MTEARGCEVRLQGRHHLQGADGDPRHKNAGVVLPQRWRVEDPDSGVVNNVWIILG